MIKTVYHGSLQIIRSPRFGVGESFNDFGLGFYCTENLVLASEWASSLSRNGFVSRYSIETNGLRIVDLSSHQYTALHWLSVLLNYRDFDLFSSRAYQAADYIRSNFSVDIQNCDIMIGHRADNSNFAFAQSFLNGEIDYRVFRSAVMHDDTGRQFVVKSNRAFDRMVFDGYEIINGKDIFPQSIARDRKNQEHFSKISNASSGDFTIFRILEEGVTAYDLRLR